MGHLTAEAMRGPGAVAAAAVRDGRVPNLVVVATGPDGPDVAAAAGPVAAGGTEPIGPDTPVRLASMTKLLTTVAALHLVEGGELALDAPVSQYLPDFADLLVLDGFSGDRPRLRRPASAATVRQLLTHTAGLGYWFYDADLFRWERLTGTPNVLSGSARAFTAPLVADPGTRFSYGIATDWLGRVVEAVTGTGLDAYLTARVTGPLGMDRTAFRLTPAQRARLTPVHRRATDGTWRATGIDWPADPDHVSGGHGLYSTPRDFLRLQRALLRGGELDGIRILRERTVRAMFTDQLGGLGFPAHLPTAHPASSADLTLCPGMLWGFGLL
ncbi:MAG: serine hydrolase, partial [Kineosporiaceae bacterium]